MGLWSDFREPVAPRSLTREAYGFLSRRSTNDNINHSRPKSAEPPTRQMTPEATSPHPYTSPMAVPPTRTVNKMMTITRRRSSRRRRAVAQINDGMRVFRHKRQAYDRRNHAARRDLPDASYGTFTCFTYLSKNWTERCIAIPKLLAML